MNFTYGETVVLSRRVLSGTDGYGNDHYTFSTQTLTLVPVWPTGSTEAEQGQDLATSGLTALLPAGTAVELIDKVTVYGHDYEIDGEPDRFRSPFSGFTPGVQVRLQRVSG